MEVLVLDYISILLLLQSIPETVLLAYIGLLLIGIKPKLKENIIIAIIVSLVSLLIRVLALPTGFNVLLQLPVLILLVVYFYKLSKLYAVLASFLGLISIGLVQITLLFIIPKISGISIEYALIHPLIYCIYCFPENLILFIIVILIYRYDLAFFNIQQIKNIEHGDQYEQQ